MKPSLLRILTVALLLPAQFALADVYSDYADTLTAVNALFKSNYANFEYKKKLFGWNMDQEFQTLLAKGQNTPGLTVYQAQSLVNDYVMSTRDYHAQAILSGQPYLTLPIGIHTAEGRVFVTYVNAAQNPGPVQVGDEVLSYDGKPAFQAVSSLITEPENAPRTDLRDAERRINTRYAMLFDPVPPAPSMILTLKNRQNQIYSVTLSWTPPPPVKNVNQEQTSVGPIPRNLQGRLFTDPYGYSAREGFLPKPDQVTWQSDDKSPFHAWVGVTSAGTRVGMIRIPGFDLGSNAEFTGAVNEFKRFVEKMNRETDVLILDTSGNRGGMLDYAYALSSFFFDQAVDSFKFQYRLFPALVQDAKTTLPQLEALHTQADIEKFFEGSDYAGYPVNAQFVAEMKTFYQGLSEDADAGKILARPLHYNIKKVRPYPGVRPYLKPLIVMIDEWSVSCGDFFAAFLQDTNRALIVGSQSAGAGAFVGSGNSIKNPLNFKSFHVPIALGFRLDGSILENVGVTPDITLAPTANDLKGARYPDMKQSLYEIVDEQ